MSYHLGDYTEQELLLELISRKKPTVGPFKVTWSVTPLVRNVACGTDNTASIYFHEDDLEALRKEVDKIRAKSPA